MNEDNKELIEYLDEKFSTIETKLDKKADKEITDKILDSQDEIITKLNTLLQEKTVGDEQDKRQKKVLEIHNEALKTNKILSEQQATEIDGMRVF